MLLQSIQQLIVGEGNDEYALAACTKRRSVAREPEENTPQLIRPSNPTKGILSRPLLHQFWPWVQEILRHPIMNTPRNVINK